MSKDKFLNSDFKPDENTRQEIETLHKDGESLSDIQLKYADMRNAKLVNADLSRADLTRADFSGASLYGVNLEGANLFKTNLEGANLKAANLKNCNMLGADFTNSKLNNVDWGDDKAQETVRKALAVGADRGIHVKTDGLVEPLAVSKILQKIVEKEKPDLVFMGKQAIDDDCNQTGQMLAALLKWPQATFVSKIEVKEKSLEVTREVDEGLETIETNIPAIVTCDLRLNEPRYASLPNIMKAKKKSLEQINASDLGVDIKPRIEQIKVEEPPKRKSGIKVKSVEELLQKLKKEAKVI